MSRDAAKRKAEVSPRAEVVEIRQFAGAIVPQH